MSIKAYPERTDICKVRGCGEPTVLMLTRRVFPDLPTRLAMPTCDGHTEQVEAHLVESCDTLRKAALEEST